MICVSKMEMHAEAATVVLSGALVAMHVLPPARMAPNALQRLILGLPVDGNNPWIGEEAHGSGCKSREAHRHDAHRLPLPRPRPRPCLFQSTNASCRGCLTMIGMLTMILGGYNNMRVSIDSPPWPMCKSGTD